MFCKNLFFFFYAVNISDKRTEGEREERYKRGKLRKKRERQIWQWGTKLV